jgi:hypothetical protein
MAAIFGQPEARRSDINECFMLHRKRYYLQNLTIVQRNIRVSLQSLVAANTLLGCFLPRLDRAAGAVLFGGMD